MLSLPLHKHCVYISLVLYYLASLLHSFHHTDHAHILLDLCLSISCLLMLL